MRLIIIWLSPVRAGWDERESAARGRLLDDMMPYENQMAFVTGIVKNL